jgi:membrane protein YdbS with pleckstrin-like domain
MLPSVVLCGTATLLIGGAALYLWSVRGLPALPVRYALYGLLGILWLLELLLLGYRVIFFSYRLTTHHLFRDHGFHRASDTFIDLAAISTVRVRRGPLERLLGVGRVIVTYQGRESGALVLEGVPVPKRVALKIRNQAEAARRRLQTGS